jgi:hypothetical protein
MPNLLTTWEPLDYTKETISESKVQNGGKVIVRGILQKADTLNQNGRVYPKHILEREVRNYQKFIKENRALGECVPPGTEIYTRDGWKQIQDISNDEVIYTIDTKTNELHLQRISQKVILPFDGELYRFKNHGTYDMVLTPNHRVLTWDRTGKPVTLTAEELLTAYETKDGAVSHSSLRRAGANWTGENPERFTLLGRDHEMDTGVWAAFLGIYLAEGHSSGVKNPERIREHQVVLTQKNSETQRAIETLLTKLPFEHRIVVRADGLTKDYVIKSEKLHSHLLPLGSSRNKYVPLYAKAWSPDLLQVMLEWMLMGDGRHRVSKKGGFIPEYCTTSSQLANDVAEVMFKLGYGATVHTDKRDYDRVSPDPERMILAENSAPMHIVYQHSSRGMSLDFRFMQVEKVPYKGDVFCVTVPNGTWLMRHNDKVCWTRNCDHPDSSVINLKNVSHIIREAFFEGDTVKGVVEILDTPSGKILQSLVESGVKLGISSRGVGTTTRQGDHSIVQDDFQLVCWDFVSEPSTPNAFMLAEGAQIDAAQLRKVFNKSDRINRVINDILSLKKD